MRRIYEFLLILLVGGFVYLVIDSAADRIINKEESNSVDSITSN